MPYPLNLALARCVLVGFNHLKLLTMKKLLVSSVLLLLMASCQKEISTQYKTDTLYLPVDTFTRYSIIMDTIIHYDTHKDTVIQVRHDTLIIKTTLIDTLWRHDTIVRINTVTRTDTVYKMPYLSAYPVPATDSGTIFISWDTIPGFVLSDITIANIGTFNGFSYEQSNTYQPQFNGTTWFIRVVKSMIAVISFHYSWTNPVKFQLQTFHFGSGILHTWEVYSPGGIGGGPGTVHCCQEARFDYIDLPEIFQINISNPH